MLTLFTWGYWGWGNATKQLIESVDMAAAAAHLRAPFFVDIRLRRQGRAKGFIGEAFSDAVGAKRYYWMQDLGNERIATGNRGIKIKRPEAAADLLDLALKAARDQRRVIFFCACEFPWCRGKRWCHRDAVTELLLVEARKRGKSISIIEWPGGKPRDEQLRVDRKLFSSVMNGRMYVPFGSRLLPKFAGLPWGSVLTLESPVDGRKELVAVGPPSFSHSGADGGYWRLPVCLPAEHGQKKSSLLQEVRKWRRECGLHERYSAKKGQ